jgi:hypothetical protein
MHARPTPVSRRLLLPLLCLLLGLSATGCGGTGTVSGKVTYKGKPVPSGTITFQGSDGNPVSAQLDKEGNYTARNVKTGDAKVTITAIDESKMLEFAEALKKQRRGEGPKPGDKPVIPQMPKGALNLVPAQYGQFDTSGLTATIKSGSNTQNFDLK